MFIGRMAVSFRRPAEVAAANGVLHGGAAEAETTAPRWPGGGPSDSADGACRRGPEPVMSAAGASCVGGFREAAGED